MLLTVDSGTVNRVSALFSSLGLSRDRYEDPLLFPPKDDEAERQLGFFLSMVGIDHRTRTELTDFSAEIHGRSLSGADLLYYLGMKVYQGDERSFTPRWLAHLVPEEAKHLLCFGDNCVWDFYTRIFLLRDLGKKVRKITDLLLVDSIEDLTSNLSSFRAYEDPVRKKTFLLAKFLDGRGLARFSGEKHVPVDNHLTRIAVRLGIVLPSESLLESMRESRELTREEDVEVRMVVRQAWKEVSARSGVDPFTLDDFLWPLGRLICTREPHCSKCPLSEVCRSNSTGEYWEEPRHTLTWYY